MNQETLDRTLEKAAKKKKLAATFKPNTVNLKAAAETIKTAEANRKGAIADIDRQIEKARADAERIAKIADRMSAADFEKVEAIKAEQKAAIEKIEYLEEHRMEFIDAGTMQPAKYAAVLESILLEADKEIEKSQRELLEAVKNLEAIGDKHTAAMGYIEELLERLQDLNGGAFTEILNKYDGKHRAILEPRNIEIQEPRNIENVIDTIRNNHIVCALRAERK